MNTSDMFAGVSSLFSLVALAVSYHTFRGGVRHASRPVQVFRAASAGGCALQNVGTGPAIQVLVIDFGPGRRSDGITNYFPIATGASIDLTWLDTAHELGVVYTDRFGAAYSTTCIHNTNNPSERNVLPNVEPDVDQWVQQLEGRTRGSALRARQYRNKGVMELDILRNEIYARHGYVFRRPDLREHFGKQHWYKPISSVQREIELSFSPAEKYETVLILHVQHRFGLLTDRPSPVTANMTDGSTTLPGSQRTTNAAPPAT